MQMNFFQRTLKREISLSGIGLHSGKPVALSIKPARPNQGVIFVRTDLPGQPQIAAHYKNITDTRLATTIGRGQVSVSTIEHLLAALQGMGVDNATVEVDGPEVPIMDGSSQVFCQEIEEAGLQSQLQFRPYLALRRKVELRVGEKWAVAEPSNKLEIHATVEFDHPSIGFQEFSYVEGVTRFSEMASARTFGFLREVEALKRMGLARGGSLDNAVVLDDASILNPSGLRYPNEFARHKVLDALGDIKLAGIPIHAHIRLHRAGHDLHGQLLQAIFKDPSNYEIVDRSIRDEFRPSRVRAAIARLVASV
jgi:UDP-3-O-[3-hydroxymyristoyl] N-acetylglucosamine deacetylase